MYSCTCWHIAIACLTYVTLECRLSERHLTEAWIIQMSVIRGTNYRIAEWITRSRQGVTRVTMLTLLKFKITWDSIFVRFIPENTATLISLRSEGEYAWNMWKFFIGSRVRRCTMVAPECVRSSSAIKSVLEIILKEIGWKLWGWKREEIVSLYFTFSNILNCLWSISYTVS